jgi:hypothetical protein
MADQQGAHTAPGDAKMEERLDVKALEQDFGVNSAKDRDPPIPGRKARVLAACGCILGALRPGLAFGSVPARAPAAAQRRRPAAAARGTLAQPAAGYARAHQPAGERPAAVLATPHGT